MSRRILAAVAALLLCLVGVAPARADSTVTVRTLSNDPNQPSNPLIVQWGCAGPPQPSSETASVVTDSAPAPVLGDASWGIKLISGTADLEVGPAAVVGSAADLATFSVKLYGVSSGQALIYAAPPDRPAQYDFWVGKADLTVAPGWATVSVPTSTTYSWQLYDFSSHPVPVGSPEARTLAGFEAVHGASDGYEAGLLFGCSLSAGGPGFYYDAFKWGASGQVTTYDFEKLASTATATASPTTITAGGATTISATSGFFNSMTLQQRKLGSSTWQSVKSVDAPTPSGTRTFTAKVAPTTQTSYRWSGAERSCCLAAVSPSVTVKVRTAVTLRLADSTLKKGQTLVASGATTPHKPGATVTLWRMTATGASPLASSTVRADGTYRIAYRVPSKGTWRVFVKIPATSGNLAGQSVVRSATVS